jgi:radical SAM superfamily enzyme YgiQ (UPF0313 family)
VAKKSGVLLVSCYELGHQPLGIAWPGAFLERAGFKVDFLDLHTQALGEEKVRRAGFIGISVPMHTALRLGVRLAERIRELNSTCHICFYGLYASLNAEYLLQHCADSVLGGELEERLLSLIESLAAGRKADSPTDRGAALTRLRFPVPSRHALPPLERYAHLAREGELLPAGYVEASRGCLHSCRHCPIPPVYGGRFFVVPQDAVLADIRQLVAAGARHISFGDPDFLNGPGHSLGILRRMHREFPELGFDFTAKVSHLLKHRALFTELVELGCRFVVSAVESLSDRVLARLQKGHSRADVLALAALARKAGLCLRPTFVSFTPWTTLDDYLELLKWVESEELIEQVDPVQFSIRLLIPPGSALLDERETQPFLGSLVEETLSYRWTHPDPRMDDLQLSVARLVEEAAAREEEPRETFSRIRTSAFKSAGRPPSPLREPRPPRRPRPPRLTEDWFC